MRIGIDARLYGVKHTGIGRYVQNLIQELAKIDRLNEYYIFGSPEIKSEIESLVNFHFVKLETKVYSVAEQAVNPIIFGKYKLDLLHVPHFNAPLLYQGKMVITVHDLIKHFSSGRETTTLPAWQYSVKMVGYKAVVASNLSKAKAIITPSAYWRDYLVENYHLENSKVHVTYEAVGNKAFLMAPKKTDVQLLEKYNLKKPFIIYTGNLYPHKNVPFLINAINVFNQQHNHQLQLAIVCARDLFADRLVNDSTVKYIGYVPDEDLVGLYHQALALAQPSLIEGFGLTGLEAMMTGLPVLSSNATCLPEIYADAALYFDPHKTQELVDQIHTLITNPTVVKKIISEGKERVKDFSWSKMARETLSIYQSL